LSGSVVHAGTRKTHGRSNSALIVILYRDLPAKHLFCGQPWETDGDPEPSFDYSELEPTLPSDSILAQKVRDAVTGSFASKLIARRKVSSRQLSTIP
jgi:hypothetical protein